MRKFFYPTSAGFVESADLMVAARKAGVDLVPTVPFGPFTGALPLAEDAGLYCNHPALVARCFLIGVPVAVWDSVLDVFHTYTPQAGGGVLHQEDGNKGSFYPGGGRQS